MKIKQKYMYVYSTLPVRADQTLSVLSSDPLTTRVPQNSRQVITWSSWPFSNCKVTIVRLNQTYQNFFTDIFSKTLLGILFCLFTTF